VKKNLCGEEPSSTFALDSIEHFWRAALTLAGFAAKAANFSFVVASYIEAL
jgi:hypothetical protein